MPVPYPREFRDDVVAVARKRGVDGMIVSNTTISRPATLRDKATTRMKIANLLVDEAIRRLGPA